MLPSAQWILGKQPLQEKRSWRRMAEQEKNTIEKHQKKCYHYIIKTVCCAAIYRNVGMRMIELTDISFSYGKKRILNKLSLSVRARECVVLAGPNGCGKSTALSVMAGVLRPDAGTVRLGGCVGFVPQGTALFEDMTVGDNLRFFAQLKKCPVPVALPFGAERYLGTRVDKLSGGMKKQVSIACALLGDPQVLLLDEPCGALDAQYRQELVQLVLERKQQGCAIVYVGHEPQEFSAFYDKLVFLGKGEYTRQQLSPQGTDDLRFCSTFYELVREESPNE